MLYVCVIQGRQRNRMQACRGSKVGLAALAFAGLVCAAVDSNTAQLQNTPVWYALTAELCAAVSSIAHSHCISSYRHGVHKPAAVAAAMLPTFAHPDQHPAS